MELIKMDTIRIDSLIFSGKHGVYKKERNVEQEFEVSVEMNIDPKDTLKAAETERLKDTVDYQYVKEAVQQVICGSSCYLIEKLANLIAEKILVDERIRDVRVTVRKSHVWDNGIPSVSITRSR